MKQEYVLLKKENDTLNSLIGQSFNQKSKLEAEKILTEIHKGYFSSWSKALVYCIEPKTNEILGVGGSSLFYDKKRKRIHSDLLLDNFGIFLKAWFTFTPSGVNSIATMQTDDSSIQCFAIYELAQAVFSYNQSVGMRIRIGSSSVIARSDFNVTTPFPSSPESDLTDILVTSTYQSGTGKIIGITAGISPTTGSGSIAESGLFAGFSFTGSGGAQKRIMMAHDVISPTVSFTSGKQIVIDYTWQL